MEEIKTLGRKFSVICPIIELGKKYNIRLPLNDYNEYSLLSILCNSFATANYINEKIRPLAIEWNGKKISYGKFTNDQIVDICKLSDNIMLIPDQGVVPCQHDLKLRLDPHQ